MSADHLFGDGFADAVDVELLAVPGASLRVAQTVHDGNETIEAL
jgi:hypothetical protein